MVRVLLSGSLPRRERTEEIASSSVRIPSHSGEESSNLRSGQGAHHRHRKGPTPHSPPQLFPHPHTWRRPRPPPHLGRFVHANYGTAYQTQESPSHSPRVLACPIVPDISWVSSSSNSTTNFHLVRRASWVMPAYCMALCSETQDIV
jgi:hypothetical protein